MTSSKKSTKDVTTRSALRQVELREVDKHRERLGEQRGCNVTFDEALEDWLSTRSLEWRQEYQRRSLAMQREEILRHKWIESEKANRDLGSEAVFDWIEKHAAKWREQYERQQEREADETP